MSNITKSKNTEFKISADIASVYLDLKDLKKLYEIIEYSYAEQDFNLNITIKFLKPNNSKYELTINQKEDLEQINEFIDYKFISLTLLAYNSYSANYKNTIHLNLSDSYTNTITIESLDKHWAEMINDNLMSFFKERKSYTDLIYHPLLGTILVIICASLLNILILRKYNFDSIEVFVSSALVGTFVSFLYNICIEKNLFKSFPRSAIVKDQRQSFKYKFKKAITFFLSSCILTSLIGFFINRLLQ